MTEKNPWWATVCAKCGALVLNPEKHDEWHESLTPRGIRLAAPRERRGI